jgi:hypothetical protein
LAAAVAVARANSIEKRNHGDLIFKKPNIQINTELANEDAYRDYVSEDEEGGPNSMSSMAKAAAKIGKGKEDGAI